MRDDPGFDVAERRRKIKQAMKIIANSNWNDLMDVIEQDETYDSLLKSHDQLRKAIHAEFDDYNE